MKEPPLGFLLSLLLLLLLLSGSTSSSVGASFLSDPLKQQQQKVGDRGTAGTQRATIIHTYIQCFYTTDISTMSKSEVFIFSIGTNTQYWYWCQRRDNSSFFTSDRCRVRVGYPTLVLVPVTHHGIGAIIGYGIGTDYL